MCVCCVYVVCACQELYIKLLQFRIYFSSSATSGGSLCALPPLPLPACQAGLLNWKHFPNAAATCACSPASSYCFPYPLLLLRLSPQLEQVKKSNYQKSFPERPPSTPLCLPCLHPFPLLFPAHFGIQIFDMNFFVHKQATREGKWKSKLRKLSEEMKNSQVI